MDGTKARTYVTDYLPTIEDCYRHTIDIQGQSVMLSVLDTAGQGT